MTIISSVCDERCRCCFSVGETGKSLSFSALANLGKWLGVTLQLGGYVGREPLQALRSVNVLH